MIFTTAQAEQLLEHARESAPIECCGFMRLDGDRVDQVVEAHNVLDSTNAYELDVAALLALHELDEQGRAAAVYHSHPRTPAMPSLTDIRLARRPDWTYVIVSLADEPAIRAWSIADGEVRELPVDVV